MTSANTASLVEDDDMDIEEILRDFIGNYPVDPDLGFNIGTSGWPLSTSHCGFTNGAQNYSLNHSVDKPSAASPAFDWTIRASLPPKMLDSSARSAGDLLSLRFAEQPSSFYTGSTLTINAALLPMECAAEDLENPRLPRSRVAPMLRNCAGTAPAIADDNLQARDASMTMAGAPRCGPCNKIFTARKSYLRHLRTVHKQIVGKLPALATNECDRCHLRFARKDLLLRHTKHQHSQGKATCHLCGAQVAPRWLAEHATSWACLYRWLRNSHETAFPQVTRGGSRATSIPRPQTLWRTLDPEMLFIILDPNSSNRVSIGVIPRWGFRRSQSAQYHKILALKMFVTAVVRRILAQAHADHESLRWMALLLFVSAFTGPESECLMHFDAVRRLTTEDQPLIVSCELKSGQLQFKLTPTDHALRITCPVLSITSGDFGFSTEDDPDDILHNLQHDHEGPNDGDEDASESGSEEACEIEWLNP